MVQLTYLKTEFWKQQLSFVQTMWGPCIFCMQVILCKYGSV